VPFVSGPETYGEDNFRKEGCILAFEGLSANSIAGNNISENKNRFFMI
jgi:hypothetical protein